MLQHHHCKRRRGGGKRGNPLMCVWSMVVGMWIVLIDAHTLMFEWIFGSTGKSDGRKEMLNGLKSVMKDELRRQRDEDNLRQQLIEKDRIIQQWEAKHNHLFALHQQSLEFERQVSHILSNWGQPKQQQPPPVQAKEEDPLMEKIAQKFLQLTGTENKLTVLESFAMGESTPEAAFKYGQKYFKQFAENLEQLISSDASWCLFTTFTETPKIMLYLNLFLASEVLSLHMIKSLLQCIGHDDTRVQQFAITILKKFKPTAEEVHSARDLSFDDVPSKDFQMALSVIRRR
jgi:hypothetical protein